VACVTRWTPDSADRLRTAALRLFSKDGFDAVTVDQIAEAAGVTQRTFFRYFPNKEEVLFSEGAQILEAITLGISESEAKARPIELISSAVTRLCALFEPERAKHRDRWLVIASVPSLLERELLKRHDLATEIAQQLESRGLAKRRAAVLAGASIAAFQVVYVAWLSDKSRTSLASRVHQALLDLALDLSA
jgi:AcrR family transcriptional regulator